MDIGSLLGLRGVTLQDIAKSVYQNTPGVTEWNEDTILNETIKSAQVVQQSIQLHLGGSSLDPMIRNQLVAVYQRLGNIMNECARRKIEMQTTAQVARIERDLDVPD